MNLDELNELFTCAWTNEDKALMFEGIVRGSNGVMAPPSSPAQMRKANELGLKWRKEAEDFLAKSSADGKKSAEARKAKYGTAQPPSDISRTPFEEVSNQATSYKLQAVKDKQQATTPFASLTSAESSQQSENTAGEQSAAPTQTLASSQVSSAQPQIEALATRPASKQRPAPEDSVAASIYALYPRKVARAAALKAIKKALVENPDIDMSEAVTEYAKATSTWKESDKTYIPYPASWFNGGCFLDDRNEWWKKSTTSPVISRGRRI